MSEDPIVEEFRRAGNAYAESFNYDLDAMFEDLKSRQQKRGARVVSYAVEEPTRRHESETEHATRA